MSLKKTPVVVRAHAYGQPFWSQYRRMVKDIGRESVFLLWDVTNNPIPQKVVDEDDGYVIPITEHACRAINCLHTKGYDTCESMMVIVAEALNIRVPCWEHVWLIEYDVACCGHWGDTLLLANGSPEHKDIDLMGYHFEQWKPLRYWMWGRLVGNIASAAKTPKEWKIFIPVMRMSRRSIEGALKFNLGKCSGYVECYFSTILMHYGYTVGNLPDTMIGRHFDSPAIPHNEWLSLEQQYAGENVVYHAIKINQL
jgi:hypothetical protein